jgi:hypothetical protein
MGLLYFIYSFFMVWQKGCTLVSQLRGSLADITWAYPKPGAVPPINVSTVSATLWQNSCLSAKFLTSVFSTKGPIRAPIHAQKYFRGII